MANITSFSVQSPYDQQMEELKRRQRMAELMQQEAMQPLESQVAPGGMVVPTSPVLGLAKLLQGYMSGKQLRDIEKQRGEAEQGARTEALDFLRSFSPERKTIGMGEAFGAGLPIPQISDKGQVSYQAPSVTAMPNARPVGSLDQPMQMQVGGPLGRRDQLARAEEGMFSSNPLVRALAQTKYEAASRPVNLMDYMDKPKLENATPESVRAYTESIAQGAPDPSVLRYTTKPQPVSQATVMRNGKKVVIDANTNREIGQAPAEEMTPYQRRMLELREQELAARTTPGKTPMSATAQKELFQADENVASTATGISMLEDALKLSGKAYEGPAAYQRAYVATTLPNAIAPAGAAETIEFDNLLKQQVLPQMKSIFGANPTEGERAILLDMQGSSNLPKNVREAIIKRGIEAAKRRMAFEQQKAQRLRSGEYFAEPKLPAGFEIEGQ